MSLNWGNLRAWNGSVNIAFEKLCCQLAEYEQIKNKYKFTTKGTRDAGVECFWKLTDESEWGWQAKFHLTPPDNSQWQNIDRSVKTALEKHPKLVKYIVCIPIDRDDPRIDSESFMDKWDDRVEKWKGWADENGMQVEFKFWGEYEIFERLSLEQHVGRRKFWFNEDWFSLKWFKKHFKEQRRKAGNRYTSQIHVDLPIVEKFNSLTRREAFYKKLKDYLSSVKDNQKYIYHSDIKFLDKKIADSFEDNIGEIYKRIEEIVHLNYEPIQFEGLVSITSEVIAQVECFIDLITTKKKSKKKSRKNLQEKDFRNLKYHLRQLLHSLNNLIDYCSSKEAKLSNKKALLLTGTGGIGKTHLLCDVAKERIKSELPTLLLFGTDFTHAEPWSQINQIIQLGENRQELLGALDAAAQAKSTHALIIIDALNEGRGKTIWEYQLGGLLEVLKDYPRISIALSVRTTYRKAIINDNLIDDLLIEIFHEGFADHEYKATEIFFDHYDIERPQVPLLIPEFSNPLFLKLFCIALQNESKHKVEEGIKGITSVYNFFLDSINLKLSSIDLLDFDPKDKKVQKAVQALAKELATTADRYLRRDKAKKTVNNFLPNRSYDKSLFKNLISEGILREVPIYKSNSEWEEGIDFAYEKFADHLIAKALITQYLDNNSFEELIKDRDKLWDRGVIDALSIQVPERLNKELIDLLSEKEINHYHLESFVESIKWREVNTIDAHTLDIINKRIIADWHLRDELLDCFLTVSTNPNHPYNANFLHNHLHHNFTLAERDSWWVRYLHYHFNERSSVKRVVDWAWSDNDKSHIKNESILLCGITISWFFSSTNKKLRDQATKALVVLFTPRLELFIKLFKMFRGIDDPYILERVLAAGYGACMRSRDKKAKAQLAKTIYSEYFKAKNPPTHLLSRDYARGIIENVIKDSPISKIEISNIRPPYVSQWPSFIPQKKELEKLYKKNKDEKETQSDLEKSGIFFSVYGGDFGRKKIQNEFGSYNWSCERLGQSQTTKEKVYEYLKSLTQRQFNLIEEYLEYLSIRKEKYLRSGWDDKKNVKGKSYTRRQFSKKVEVKENYFLRSIGKKKRMEYDEFVKLFLLNPDYNKDSFNADLAKRWILNRILNIGWDKELHGDFDQLIRNYQRGIVDKISAKYKWIAFYEFLGIVSDNFKYNGDIGSNTNENYEGPWQLICRDIDPSITKKRGRADNWNANTLSWWFKVDYQKWYDEKKDKEWLNSIEDLPKLNGLIEIDNPNNGSKWICLDTYVSWDQRKPDDNIRPEKPVKELFYSLKTYLIDKKNLEKLYDWAKTQVFYGGWMPKSHNEYSLYLGEYYWSNSFRTIYENASWKKEVYRNEGELIPGRILNTCYNFLKEDATDYSLTDSIKIKLPTFEIFKKMNLVWYGTEGLYYDQDGELVVCDPSVHETGPNALLFRKNSLSDFLKKNNYALFGTVTGEKYIHTPKMNDYRGRLEISGAYCYKDGKLEGFVDGQFKEH